MPNINIFFSDEDMIVLRNLAAKQGFVSDRGARKGEGNLTGMLRALASGDYTITNRPRSNGKAEDLDEKLAKNYGYDTTAWPDYAKVILSLIMGIQGFEGVHEAIEFANEPSPDEQKETAQGGP